MADLATIVEQLNVARVENERQRHELLLEAQSIEAALAALGTHPTPAPVEAPVETRPAVPETRPKQGEARPKKPAATTKKQTYVPCPKCGFECTPQNMWRHDRSAHGEIAAKPAPVVAAVPAPKAAPSKSGKVLACTECDFTTEVHNAKAMSQHTITSHRRGPLLAERTPTEVAA